jgi:hypothetical protein
MISGQVAKNETHPVWRLFILHTAFLIGMKKTVKQALEPVQIGDAHAFLGSE